MTRAVSSLVVVTLAAVMFIGVGGAVTVADASEAGTNAVPTVTPSEAVEPEAGDAFGTNVSVHSEEFDGAEQDFYDSRNTLVSRSESLIETVETIEETDAYSDEDHERATENLELIEGETRAFNDAEDDARDALADADLGQTERFLVLEAIDEERNSTEATVEDSLGQYETAVRTQRADARSTVLVYFGGALIAGLLGGTLFGAVVPLVEAKKTGDKMKLSRNVSYKKRAGLIPVGIGLAIVVGAVGLSLYLGAGDLIRVMV